MLGTVLRGVAEATITTKIGIPRGNGRSSAARVAYRSMIRPWLGWFPGVKSGLIRRMPSRPSLGPAADPTRRRISRDELERSLDESLRQLRRHRIELYLIHEPDQFELSDELVDAMESIPARWEDRRLWASLWASRGGRTRVRHRPAGIL